MANAENKTKEAKDLATLLGWFKKVARQNERSSTMIINEKMMAETIQEALAEQDNVRSVLTFDEAGMLTQNNGLVVRISDGSEFQITIVQSR